MKDKWERSSQVRRLREHPIHRCAVPLPQGGKAKRRRLRRKKESQPRFAALGSPFQGKGLAWILPPSYGRRCPKGAEVGWEKRYERQVGKIVSSAPFTRAPYPPLRGPPSPRGEGKEEAASPQKRKPTPLRCARQPLPREGACVDTPSFLWKEVPQRGGGWKGKAVFLYHSLPKWGRGPVGADRSQAAGKRAVLKSSSH